MQLTDDFTANHPNDTAMADKYWRELEYLREPLIRAGDTFTISGVVTEVQNPAWRWWAFWRPKMIPSGDLQIFKVTG